MPGSGRRGDWGTWALNGALTGGAAAALLASALLRPGALPGIETCSFHKLTGLPCPGCGLSHSFCAISHGDLGQAWALNPFGFVFYVLALWLVLRPVLRAYWPGYGRYEDRVFNAPRLWLAPVGLVAAMWAFGAWRIVATLH